MIAVRIPLSALALVIWMGCTTEGPEAQVKRSFDRCVQDLERGDGPAALEVLSPGFEGPEGMDRDAARLFLLGLLKQDRLSITVLQSQITAREQEATQEISAVVIQKGGGTVLPKDSSRQSFRIRWEKRKGDWRVRGLRRVE